jgi:hypothetical protein
MLKLKINFYAPEGWHIKIEPSVCPSEQTFDIYELNSVVK